MESGTWVRIIGGKYDGVIGIVLADRGAAGVWVEVPGPYQYNRYWFGRDQLRVV
jgi:hypothetical protein